MSITINSNILSLNAQRRLGQHTNNLRSSFEKLSSGLRVSKASDDAAGLSISENLKTDARLSSQALRNVNDGISMISIITGTLDSQKQILNRMGELAEQSANGVNSTVQRQALEKEYLSLQEEFDRVASAAKFNGISLLRNPDPQSVRLMTGITGASSSLIEVAAANSHRFNGELTFYVDSNFDDMIGFDDLNPFLDAVKDVETNPGEKFTGIGKVKATTTDGTEVEISVGLLRIGSDFFASGNPLVLGPVPANFEVAIFTTETGNRDNNDYQQVALSSTANTFTISGTLGTSGQSYSKTLDLSGITYTTAENPNDTLRPSNIGFTSVSIQSQAKHAVDAIRNKIEDLSKLQGSFGAIESRLSVAANRLQVDRENFQAAASQITDVDVATEAAKLTNTQILQQAATSILAQANQQPQIALQLLGGL